MPSPKYFKNFPNSKYAFSVNKSGKPNYINIKDYFHYMNLREDLFPEDTLYYQHIVQNGERADQISFTEYGDEQYYWIILQINHITDVHTQWPLSQLDLRKHILRKYGSDREAQATRHYETVEVKDEEGNLLLPAGLIVNPEFEFAYGVNIYRPVPVSNAAWEERENELKSDISLLRRDFIDDYAREYRNYGRNLPISDSEVNISDYFL